MHGKWTKLATMPIFAAALWFAGCSDQGSPADHLLAPDAATFAKGGNETAKQARDKKEKGPKVNGKKKNGAKWAFRLATGQLSQEETPYAKQVIDIEGGYLTVAGHVLVVPEGSVTEPTLFKMRQYRKQLEDGSTIVAADLKAVTYDCDKDGIGESTDDTDLSCVEIDVGAAGFAVPVELYLTYRWSDNVDDTTVDSTTIVWLKSSSYAEEVPHAVVKNKGAKFVHTKLDHFSSYALAYP